MGQEITKRRGRPRKTEALQQARIDAEAAELRNQKLSYRQVAEAMGCDLKTAHVRVQRAIAAVPYEAVETMRAIEGQALDEDERRLREVRARPHVLVSHGRVVKNESGEPILDDEPVIRATMAINRIRERRARLFGLDIPTTQHHEVKVEHTTAADAELERLAGQLGARALEEGSVARGGEG